MKTKTGKSILLFTTKGIQVASKHVRRSSMKLRIEMLIRTSLRCCSLASHWQTLKPSSTPSLAVPQLSGTLGDAGGNARKRDSRVGNLAMSSRTTHASTLCHSPPTWENVPLKYAFTNTNNTRKKLFVVTCFDLVRYRK